MQDNKLNQLLKKAQGNLTQNEFAKRCGLSSSNLTRIYRNEQKPSPKLLKRIADYTCKNPSYEDLMVAADYWDDGAGEQLTSIKKIFNFRLNEIREEKGLSIQELSETSGISEDDILCMEDHLRMPHNRDELFTLAAALDTDARYLTGEIPYPTLEERDHAYEHIEALSSLITHIDTDYANKIMFNLNEILENINRLEKLNNNPSINNFESVLVTVLKEMNKLSGLMGNYRNLFHGYQVLNSDKVEYIEDFSSITESQKIQIGTFVYAKHNELVLQVHDRVDKIKQTLLDYCETTFEENYKDAMGILLPSDESNKLDE